LRSYKEHLILSGTAIKEALVQLDTLASDAILFVVDDNDKLIGSLTDGDVRRALIKDISTAEKVDLIIQANPKQIKKNEYDIHKVIEYRKSDFKILPIVDEDGVVTNVINFRLLKSYLPVDAIIMAGGRGSRLAPLTDTIPKPLLPVGDKPIMEHNLDRLALYGIDDFYVSIRYLGQQIIDYFGKGDSKNIKIEYLGEDEPLGTIGAVSQVSEFQHNYVLLTNSDLLTNLDYERFFLDFMDNDADISIVSIPYRVDIPYAVLETNDNVITDFKEKPTYTYYSNGGIYLFKKEILESIPKNTFYNATDLLDKALADNKNVISYPLSNYWLDVGKPADYEKAQRDINQIKF
jgi:dTDP-glucose pyrophosphorylase